MPGILLILAHPDDETFFAAGTIAKYAESGVDIGLVCATRGERGATGDLCSIEELPRVREAELREAARILGIRSVDVLPYEDQKLRDVPPGEIRPLIVGAVRRQRPEIVITFDPNGSNQHPDHIAISRFAADAISAAADERLYPELGAAHRIDLLLWDSPVQAFRLNEVSHAHEPGIDILIDIAPFRDKKEAAMRAHRTQFPGLRKLFCTEGALSFEAFRVAWGRRPDRVP